MNTQAILNFQNAKTIKGEAHKYMTGIIYLAPNNIANSAISICPFASAGCIKACLYTAGRGGFNSTQKARIKKTQFLLSEKEAFIARLEKEIGKAKRKAENKGFKLTIRLNGTSDLPVETWGVMEKYPDIQYYDYTKNPSRMARFLAGQMPKNYHLTFSLSETNKEQAKQFLEQGGNVAVVFRKKKKEAYPAKYWGHPVIDGDLDDLRFLDDRGVIVGLRNKGRAGKDELGFVQPLVEG